MKNKKELFIIGGIALTIAAGLILIFCFGPKEKISQTKKVDGLVFQNGKVTVEDNISTLSADVTNKGDKIKEDIRLEITFYDKKKNEIVTISGYLGDLDVNGKRELKASVTDDLTNAYDVKYEIVE